MIINKIKNLIITIGFFVLISLPILSLFINFTPEQVLNEKRNLAKIPKPSLKTIFFFPKQFETYFNDNFGFRAFLIRCYTYFKINLLKSSQVSKVVIGKDGWLFFAGDDVINDYRCAKPFTEAELKTIATALTEREKWLKDLGIKFIVVIAPNKHSIYPEKLPYTIKPIRDKSRFDQLKEYLNNNTNIQIIDLRKPLINGKKQYPTYCNTDTHWTRFGALIATSNIIMELKRYFPEIPDVNFKNYSFALQKTSGDLARMINMEKEFPCVNVKVIPKSGFKARKASYSFSVPAHLRKTVVKETNKKKLPNVLVFRDSFSDALSPILSEYFYRSVYVWCYKFLPHIVEKEKPDIVILEVAERLLKHAGVKNPQQVKKGYHKSTNENTAKQSDYKPIIFESFSSAKSKKWMLNKNVAVSNNYLVFNPASNIYTEVCRVVKQIKPETSYKISIRVRKNGKCSKGYLISDLFLAGKYDNPEQEIVLPVNKLSKQWKIFSKNFNSGNAPEKMLLRIGLRSSAKVYVDWIKLEEEN